MATHYAAIINGIDELAVTNLDGLDTVENIKVCVAYRAGTARLDYMPADIELLAACEPVYAEFPGWLAPDHPLPRLEGFAPRGTPLSQGAGGLDGRAAGHRFGRPGAGADHFRVRLLMAGGPPHLSAQAKATIPGHVAIIMDGNGRWAKQRRLPRVEGHRHGVESVRAVVRAAGEAGVKHLTLYAFSVENWNRPKDEVDTLDAIPGAVSEK